MSRIRRSLLAAVAALVALSVVLGAQGAQEPATAAQTVSAAKAKHKAPPKRTRAYCAKPRHRRERVCVIQRRCWHKAGKRSSKARRDAARRKCVRQPRRPQPVAPAPAPGPEQPTNPAPGPGPSAGDGRYCAEGPIGPRADCIWYTRNGPWNTPIADGAYARTALPTQTPTGPITSDPGQYAYPIYLVDNSTPKVNVAISGVYGDATANDTEIAYVKGSVQVPLKPEFVASAGSDGSLIVINTDTGDEYGFWQLKNNGGSWSATNGSHYSIKWDGSPGDGNDRAFTSRGAGLPYGAGIVKAWEVKQGRIDHALAMALGGAVKAGTSHVFPATKSDGTGGAGGVPEGSRYQLDPSINVNTMCGSSPVALMMARAMQKYGVYVVDNSGRTKIFVEGNPSANWGGTLTANTPYCIPVDKLRRVS